jgi:hypothetical protein
MEEIVVRVFGGEGGLIWERGENRGIACRGYVSTGVQAAIISALKEAVAQSEAELLLFDVGD